MCTCSVQRPLKVRPEALGGGAGNGPAAAGLVKDALSTTFNKLLRFNLILRSAHMIAARGESSMHSSLQ